MPGLVNWKKIAYVDGMTDIDLDERPKLGRPATSMMASMPLSKMIKDLDLTWALVAERMAVSTRTLYYAVCGHSEPTNTVIVRLADATGIPVRTIFIEIAKAREERMSDASHLWHIARAMK